MMRVLLTLLAIVISAAATGQAKTDASGRDTVATIHSSKESATTFTGVLRKGQIQYPGSDKTIAYLYLHLEKPVDIFGTGFGRNRRGMSLHNYDIQVVWGGGDVTVKKLNALVGEKVTLHGRFPVTPVANAEDWVPIGPTMHVTSILAGNDHADLDDHVCAHPHNRFGKALCAKPEGSDLASRLSRAYRAALARDPSRAKALQQDQRNWRGQWNMRYYQRMRYAQSSGNRPSEAFPFSRIYMRRITFLERVGNPAATRGAPIAHKLLAAIHHLPAGTSDVLKALAQTDLVMIAQPPRDNPRIHASKLVFDLPAPPSPALRKALDRTFPGLPGAAHVVYLPQAKLGGAYVVSGTAYCQAWVLFRKHGDTTVPVPRSNTLSGACARDDGSTGYLAVIDGHPVAINETIGIHAPTTDLQWRRWTGFKWGPATRIRVRFAWVLESSNAPDCSPVAPTSQGCDAVGSLFTSAFSKAARKAVAAYIQDPWAMRDPSWLAGSDRAQFLRMQSRIQEQQPGCVYAHRHYDKTVGTVALWFPDHIDGQLVVGCISPGHIGAHPQAGFEVAYWGHWAGKQLVSLPGDYVVPRNGLVLAAARVPPKRLQL
jgi:uncharacterized protein YecT (DUF1311 family)